MKMHNNQRIVPCTVVGDGMVGKTTLALSFVEKRVPDTGYVATVFDNYAGNVTLHGIQYTVSIFDSPGQHDYQDVRTFSYRDSDVIIVCYSVADRDSFRNVKDVWIPEAKGQMKRKKPLILVGCQADLRKHDNKDHVTAKDGLDLASEVGADLYLECSSVSRSGVMEVFQSAVNLVLKNKKKKSSIMNRLLRR